MLKKHLFLRLYQKNFRGVEKPLTEYIQDFDKTKNIKYYAYNDTKEPLERKFRNLDELILYKKAIVNIMFAIRYMKYLQLVDRFEDISLQEIFELSLLMDKDTKPTTDVFKSAYISDSRRNEINIYESYYRLLLWDELGVADLEFSRRITDCLINSVPSNKTAVTLDDDITYTSPYIQYDKSHFIVAVAAEITEVQKQYDTELSLLEESLLKRIKMPKGVHFDGNRFTILIDGSPISLMFDINPSKTYNVGGMKNETINKNRFKKSNHNHYIGGINVQHPTQLQPAFINRELSERCGSWWNGRTSWDYTWKDIIDESIQYITNGITVGADNDIINKLEIISFILLLKNGGCIKGTTDNIVDVFKTYRTERSKINIKYNNVIEAQSMMASTLMDAHNKREIVLFYESHSGYIASFYKPYKTSDSRKLDSRAEFYDKDFNLVGTSAFYSDFVVNETYKKHFYDGGKRNTSKLRKDMTMRTFKKLADGGRIMNIDYAGFNTQQQLKQCVQLIKGNDGTQVFTPHVYQVELFKTTLRKMMIANSIDTYTTKLQEQIHVNGYADINNYSRAVELISDNKMVVSSIESELFILPSETGALTCPSTKRDIVVFRYKNRRKIDTENYSSFEKHIEFTDIEYVDARESVEYREALNNTDYEGFVELVEYEENYLQKRRDKRKKMVYKTSTDKRTKKKSKSKKK